MTARDVRLHNKAAVGAEIAARRDRVASYPFEIQFSGEHRCNLRCIQCGATIERNQGAVPLMDQRLPQRSFERFLKLRAQIPAWEWLSLTGSGETLINPELPEILGVLRDSEHDCAIGFNTNGTLWTRERAVLVVTSGVGEIRFSMDGATKATFERIRVNAKFEKVVEAIRMLRSVRDELGSRTPRITFSCNFMRQNIEELPLLVELAPALGAVALVANNTIIFDPAMADEALSRHVELTERMLDRSMRRARELGIEFTNNLLTRDAGSLVEAPAAPAAAPAIAAPVAAPMATPAPATAAAAPLPLLPMARSSPPPASPCGATKQHAEPPAVPESTLPPLAGLPADLPKIVHACQRPWTGLYVENNGFVKACCYDAPPIGNLDLQSFDEIWNGPLARELRRSFLENRPPEGCRRCPIFSAHGGADEVFVRPIGASRSNIDQPGLDPNVSGTALVHGWAIDRDGIARAELLVDGGVFGEARYGHERPDVEQAFPGYPDGVRCGFALEVDTAFLTPGEHLLMVRTHSRKGAVHDGPPRPIVVVRP